MASKMKWKESFQKARSLSQTSFEAKSLEKKTSLLEEGTLSLSDDELDQYLGTLKEKSGLNRLWTGHTFEKVVDRTPDVSISSVSDGEGQFSEQDKSTASDDFRPKLLVLSPQATEEDKSEISEPSSIKPLQAVNMISDLELSKGPLELVNNVKLNISATESQDLPMVKDVKSISNDLSKVNDELLTLDEVTEEIEEDLHSRNSGSIVASVSLDLSDQDSHKKSPRQRHHSSHHSSQHSSRDSSHRHRSLTDSSQHSSHHRKHKRSSTHDSKHSTSSKKSSRKGRSSKKSDDSYTADFSHSSNENTLNSLQGSSSYVTSNSATTLSSARAKSPSKRSSKHRNNQSHHDVATQVNTEDLHGQRLGVGMATTTGGRLFGHQYVDPSPIAPHVVGVNTMEALTAYNPAIVALTDMLKQQIRLVEQYVDNSRRMYESYTRNLNTSYKYTTLEDTMEYVDQNKVDHRKQRLNRKNENQSNEDS